MLNGGTYGPAVTMEVNRFAADLAIADVDADGELDLIISSGQSVLNGFPIEARIEVLRGVGDGTFEAPRAYGHRTIGHYKDIVVDDLNGDGMPDLVVAISNDVWPGGLGVLVNNGLGGFHEAKVYDPTASPVEGIATADFNGDGRPDILTANGFRSTFSILVGDVGRDRALRAATIQTASAVDSPLVAVHEQTGTTRDATLDPNLLPMFVQEAIARWSHVGWAAEVASRLKDLQWHVADLPDDSLGLAANQAVWLDADAAGHGWFLDPTPWDDSEFTTPGNQGEMNRIDLLSVVMHELGHLLDYGHDEDGVMAETLAAGIRRTGLEDDSISTTDHAD